MIKINELIQKPISLPDTIEDLAKFVLVGREKLTSVRAEIRAIDKVQLAKDVRNQKKEEAQMLAEALLDAEVRIGELLKAIPKSQGSRTDLQHSDSGVVKLNKPKKETIVSLGFTPKQAERFETLANNKDIVEQVKQEARENDDIPTRTRVIDLAQVRKKEQQQPKTEAEYIEYCQYIDECDRTFDDYDNALRAVRDLKVDDVTLKKFVELAESEDDWIIGNFISITEEIIPKVLKIQNYLKGRLKK